MSFNWQLRQNEMGRHKHLSEDILDPDTGDVAIGGEQTVRRLTNHVTAAEAFAVPFGGTLPMFQLPDNSIVVSAYIYIIGDAWNGASGSGQPRMRLLIADEEGSGEYISSYVSVGAGTNPVGTPIVLPLQVASTTGVLVGEDQYLWLEIDAFVEEPTVGDVTVSALVAEPI
jgi:hypothetical protein